MRGRATHPPTCTATLPGKELRPLAVFALRREGGLCGEGGIDGSWQVRRLCYGGGRVDAVGGTVLLLLLLLLLPPPPLLLRGTACGPGCCVVTRCCVSTRC